MSWWQDTLKTAFPAGERGPSQFEIEFGGLRDFLLVEKGLTGAFILTFVQVDATNGTHDTELAASTEIEVIVAKIRELLKVEADDIRRENEMWEEMEKARYDEPVWDGPVEHEEPDGLVWDYVEYDKED